MDSQSVTSDHSLSSKPLACPCCKKEVASRSIFNHLKTKHVGYFQQQTTKLWLQEAQKGKPLKVFWSIKNDFDEEELIVLFGCLASGKTFNLEHKAITHFKKNPKDLQEHNKQIVLMLKSRKEIMDRERKEEEKSNFIIPGREEYKLMKSSSDPELIEAITFVVENHFVVCDRLALDAKNNLNLTMTTETPDGNPDWRKQTIAQSLQMLDTLRLRYHNGAKTYKELSWILQHLERFLFIRRFFNGHDAPTLEYPWFKSPDHPEGLLSKGETRFVGFLYPWNEGFPVYWS